MSRRHAARVAALGIAESRYGEFATGAAATMSRLVVQAVDDAGLTLADVDALFVVVPRAATQTWVDHVVAENLGTDFALVRSVAQGGAAVLQAIGDAAAAIKARAASTAVVVGVDRLRTGLTRGAAVADMASGGYREWEIAYGPTIVSGFAFMATRYMHQYSLTREQLSSVAVAMRVNAAGNPSAQARRPLSADDVAASRMISTPLRLFDCSLVSDGGAAIVLGRTSDPRHPEVLAWGEAHTTSMPTALGDTSNVACVQAGEQAYSMAGVQPSDIGMAYIYDPFSIVPIIAAEDLGLAPRGEGASLFQPGRASRDGALPVNTHGGLLSCGHPGRPGALGHVVEAVRSLRSHGGTTTKLAVIAAEGAQLASYATLIIGAGRPRRR